MHPDIKPDIHTAHSPIPDCGESISMMEPMRLGEDSRHRAALLDDALTLAQESSALKSSLPADLVPTLARLVRSMNCYYSNLIEGHNTHPIDIDKALNSDFNVDPCKRDLQLEAAAHIRVQKWIDEGGLANPRTSDAILEVHRRFCSQLPHELLWVEDPSTSRRERVLPGQLRPSDVQVGQHIAISPGAVPRFLARYNDSYSRLGKSESILATAAAHHRLVWIHPFLDGNGRVARLISHAMLLESLDTGAIWSVARGLARRIDEYKHLLALCDRTRRNDLDGRGNLSEEALAAFTRFFLSTCIDQVRFMRELMQPETLRARILRWAQEEAQLGKLPARASTLLEAILYRGELARADLPALLNTTDRQARRITAPLLDSGVFISESTRAPLRLAFPATLAHRWLPGLFPEKLD